MKKILLSITAVLAVGFINAQIYSASDSSDYASWIPYDNDGDSINFTILDWNLTTATDPALLALGSTLSSSSWNGVALTPDNLIVSPAIDCSNEASVFVNWQAASPEDTLYFYEKYACYVVSQSQLYSIVLSGTYPTPTFEEVLPVGAAPISRSVDVSAAVGNQSDVYIIFRHYDCTNQNWLSLDNISLTAQSTASLDEVTHEALVYPNPANNVLNIEASAAANSISIITMDGKVVSTTAMSGANGSVDVSNLTEGVYVYEIAIADGSVVRNTFVKK